MRTYYIFILLLICQACQQKPDLELLTEYGSHLDELDAFEYQYRHHTVYSYTDRPTLRKGIAYFEKNPTDTLIGYNYYVYTEVDPDRYVDFYGGDKAIGLIMNDSIAYFKDLGKYPFYKRVNLPTFHESVLSIGKWTSNDSLQFKISNLEVKDTVISRQKCKMFSFETIGSYYSWWFKKPFGKNKYEVKIAFNSKSKIPVYLQSKIYLKDPDYVLVNAWFSNIVVKRYPKEKLSIESVPEYYRWGIELKKLATNTKAPNFKLPDTNGDSLELSSLKGSYVLLQYGFIGCGPCVLSVPLLNQIQDKYSSKGLKVVGINLYCGSQEKVKTYQIRHGINYEFLWSDNDSIAKLYNITSAPTIYIINEKGIIEYAQNGYSEEKLKVELEKIFGT